MLASAVYKNFSTRPGCMTWNTVTLPSESDRALR